ncbi:MAG: hypothetical protein JOZ01_05660 [Candidatus Eremiobacteraeota bacterium]|nr:hypothetical protein [Candidatus Eremiobacteraeota bacterium]
MSFIARWLNLAKDRQNVGLRPHRDIVLETGYESAFDRVLRAVDGAIGAYVAVADRRGGTIEAAFGLVNNERVRCTLQPLDETHTTVRIEAFFPATSSVRARSDAVDTLADYLTRP